MGYFIGAGGRPRKREPRGVSAVGGCLTPEKWPPRFEFEAAEPAELRSRWPRVYRDPCEKKTCKVVGYFIGAGGRPRKPEPRGVSAVGGCLTPEK